jgi:hypothetical protein
MRHERKLAMDVTVNTNTDKQDVLYLEKQLIDVKRVRCYESSTK